MADQDRKKIGDIWLNSTGQYCLILDDDPPLSDSTKSILQYGFTFSQYATLENKNEITRRYEENSNYIANPNSILTITPREKNKSYSEALYIDMLHIGQASNNAFTKKVGQLQQDDVIDILLKIEEYEHTMQSRQQGRRLKPSSIPTYDFDVAISFAGEERDIARSISLALKDKGFRVFFDEYEVSAI